MPLDGYLWLGGLQGIRGESKHYKYTHWLQVRDMDWGMSQDSTINPDGSRTDPVAELQNFTFVHELDVASPGIFDACCTSRHLPEVRFVVLQDEGDTQRERFQMVFKNCLIVSVETTSEGPGVSERVQIVFGEINVAAREASI
jgi:type VI secretion system secreted protein Hcp